MLCHQTMLQKQINYLRTNQLQEYQKQLANFIQSGKK